MFELQIENGVLVQAPQTLGLNHVRDYLDNRNKGGFTHIVAYANAKQTKKATDMGLDLAKISNCYCVLGRPKKKAKETTTTEPKREIREFYTSIDKNLIQYFKDNSIAIKTHLNKRFRNKSYYFDRNTMTIYSKDYLVENKLIQKPSTNDNNEIMYVNFKLENIVYIK